MLSIQPKDICNRQVHDESRKELTCPCHQYDENTNNHLPVEPPRGRNTHQWRVELKATGEGS